MGLSPVASEPAAPTGISAASFAAAMPPAPLGGALSVHTRSVVSAEHERSSPAEVHAKE